MDRLQLLGRVTAAGERRRGTIGEAAEQVGAGAPISPLDFGDLSGAEEPLDEAAEPLREVAAGSLSLDVWCKLVDEINGDDGNASDLDAEARSQAEALSDEDVESDVEDAAYVRALAHPHRTWETDEDRELARISKLASYLREQPHLPCDPRDPLRQRPCSDRELLENYVGLPYVHCL